MYVPFQCTNLCDLNAKSFVLLGCVIKKQFSTLIMKLMLSGCAHVYRGVFMYTHLCVCACVITYVFKTDLVLLCLHGKTDTFEKQSLLFYSVGLILHQCM